MWCLKIKCKKLTQDLSSHILDNQKATVNKEKDPANAAADEAKTGKNQPTHLHDHKRRLQSNFLVKRSLSDPQTQQPNVNSHRHEDLKRGASVDDNVKSGILSDLPCEEKKKEEASKESKESKEELDKCYDEIDQIYDYVRGFAPLPERIKSDFDNPNSDVNDESKPRPPPIETLPSLQNRRMSYPTAIKDITSPKLTVNGKRDNRRFPRNFYENNKFSYFPTVIIPFRTNSTGKIYFQSPTPTNYDVKNGLKLFIKSSSGQRNGSSRNNKIFKYAKNTSAPFRHDNNFKNNGLVFSYRQKDVAKHNSYRSNRSLTTSPIFNIRYKSLTNLKTQPIIDYNNTLESSNSGHTSSGGSNEMFRDVRHRNRLPKVSSRSLTNLFWDMTTGGFIPFDNNEKVNNELNKRKNNSHSLHLDLLNEMENLQVKDQNKSRVGTLYL